MWWFAIYAVLIQKKVNATILEIDKNHIHNMKKEVLSTVKELRSWGIFLSY